MLSFLYNRSHPSNFHTLYSWDDIVRTNVYFKFFKKDFKKLIFSQNYLFNIINLKFILFKIFFVYKYSS